MPRISVVMPIKNAQVYIRKSIESVLGQSMQDIELICVDDGSVDETCSIVNEMAETDRRIKFICYEDTKGADRKSVV